MQSKICCSNDFKKIPSCKKIFTMINHILQKNNCSSIVPPKWYTEKFKNDDELQDTDVFITWNVNKFNMRQLYIPEFYKTLVKRFIKNNNKRFFAFPIILNYPYSITYPCCTIGLNNWNSHLIMVVYDKQYGYLEVFDPSNNIYCYDAYMLDGVLINTFSNTFSIPVNGINTSCMINGINGIQGVQETEVYTYSKNCGKLGENVGFCSFFSMWYLEQRLCNRDKTPNEILLKYILIQPSENMVLTNMIIKFLKPLNKKYAFVSNLSFREVLEYLQTTKRI